NLGRAVTYAAMGALFGYIGNRLFLAGFQPVISVLLGMLILLFLGMHFFSRAFSFSGMFHRWVKSTLGRLLRSGKNHFSYLLTGIINGFLPCGLVYLAIASATATGSATGGALLMFMFGLGTFP